MDDEQDPLSHDLGIVDFTTAKIVELCGLLHDYESDLDPVIFKGLKDTNNTMVQMLKLAVDRAYKTYKDLQ